MYYLDYMSVSVVWYVTIESCKLLSSSKMVKIPIMILNEKIAWKVHEKQYDTTTSS